MSVQSWSELPVEQLNPLIGRQMLHTETMTVARIILAKARSCHATSIRMSRSRTCSKGVFASS